MVRTHFISASGVEILKFKDKIKGEEPEAFTHGGRTTHIF